MPEVSSINSRRPILFSGPRVAVGLRTGRGIFQSYLGVWIALTAFSSASSWADVPAPAPVHVTDAQNRLGDGKLASPAENRAKAAALFAQAMLLPDSGVDDQQQAASLYREVITLDPGFVDAQVRLANILLQTGQLEQALGQLQGAYAAHPNSVPIEVALGYAQRLRGQNEEAVRLCKKALASDPAQSMAMRVLLEVAADQEDLAGGVLHIEDILKNAGEKAGSGPWLNLARLYLDIARSEVRPPSPDVMEKIRLPILLQAVAKAQPTVETLTLLADTEFDLGHKVDALKHYEAAYELNAAQPGLRERLAGLYIGAGRFADAARMDEEALADEPGNLGLQIDLGIAYEQAHEPEKAQACFQRVFDTVACPIDAYLKLALFQRENHELKQAGQTLVAARRHFPQSAQICYYQAVLHRYEGDYPAALASLAEMRSLSTASGASALEPAYYTECALVLNLAGQKDRLEALLREGLKTFPDNPEMMNELAYFWADQGQHLKEALDLSRRAAALDPDNGPILDTCGWCYFQMGQPKDALPYLQRAAFMTNNDPVVLQHVGDAYLKLGLRREAIATWTRALEKDPRNGDLANRIDAAQAQAKNVHTRSAPTP